MTGRGSLGNWLRSLVRNLGAGGGAREAELDDHLRSYVELLTEENVARGLPAGEARRVALVKVGGVEAVKEQTRAARAGALVAELGRDARHALRMAVRAPVFTVAALLTLGLGIGANTVVFSVVDAVLLRPLPYRAPERLVMFHNHDAENQFGLSDRERVIYRAESGVFSSFSAYVFNSVNLTGAAEAERVPAAYVDADLFETLGVAPARGRGFVPADANPTTPGGAVILSDEFWARRFGRDPSLLGRTLTLDDQPTTVVGILPPGLRLPGDVAGNASAYLPLAFSATPDPRNFHYLTAIARLREGVSLTQANERIGARAVELRSEISTLPPTYSAALVPVEREVLGDVRPGLLVVSAAVALLLLIACGNLASLLLARSQRRAPEMAMRAALGAGRARLMRQVLTESLVLAVAGGVVGVVLAWAGTRLVVILGPNLPRLDEVRVDARALWFALGVSVVTGVLFGLLPAWVQARRGLRQVAAGTGRGTTSAAGPWVRGPLIAAQIALSVTLAIAAALLARSARELAAVPPGFDPSGVLTLRLTPAAAAYPDNVATQTLYRKLNAEIRTIPGVSAAGVVTALPLASRTGDWGLMIEGMPERLDDGRRPYADWLVASDGYFEAMGIQLLAGRTFRDSDVAGTPPVVVVNERTAREYWPGRSAVGGRLRLSSDVDPVWREVVGVVADVRHNRLDEPAERQIFLPHAQFPTGNYGPFGAMSLVVRTSGNPAALIATIRSRIAAQDRDLPVSNVRLMRDVVADSTSVQWLYLWLFGIFSALALAIVSVGVYGVASYLVAARGRELALRRVLGASGREVILLVLREGATLALAGVSAGVLGAFLLGSFIKTLLYGVTARDPLTFVAVPVVVVLVTLLANFLPARSAIRESAVSTLRLE